MLYLLHRHWKRSRWVLSVWKQANSNNINYPPLNGNGWKQTPTPLKLTGTATFVMYVQGLRSSKKVVGAKQAARQNDVNVRVEITVVQAVAA